MRLSVSAWPFTSSESCSRSCRVPLSPSFSSSRAPAPNGERRKFTLRRGHAEAFEVLDRIARGDEAEAPVVLGEPLEQRAQAFVLQLACKRRTRRVLQRLQPIQDERRALVADPFGQAPALVMATLDALDRRGVEELQSLGKEQVGRRGELLARALAVERPGESRIAIRPAFLRHTDRPFGDQRRLALAAERDKGQDARM